MALFLPAQLAGLHDAVLDACLDGQISVRAAARMKACLDEMAALEDVAYDQDRSAAFRHDHPLHRPARLLCDLWVCGADLSPWMQGLAARAQRPVPRLEHALASSLRMLEMTVSDEQAEKLERELFWLGADSSHRDWPRLLCETLSEVAG